MKKIKHNKNSISFSFFRSISMTSILFMVLLFLGISGLFLKHSFQLEGKNALQQLSYISGQFQYYLDESAISPLFAKNVELGGTSEGIGVDVFDFDPLASMQDRTRNSISSMFTGEKPDSVAKEIQSEIDK